MLNIGCFSWLRRRLWKDRIADCADHPEVQSSTGNLPEDQRIIIADVAGVTRSAVMTSSGTSSGNNRAIVPTTTEYFTASVKEALTLLQSVSSVIPVPFLSESFKVTLKIIELCEGASAVGEGVKELKARVRNLMTIIANHVKAQNYVERNKMIIANAMKDMEGDIGELLRFLPFEFGLRCSDDLVALSRQFTRIWRKSVGRTN